MLCKLLEMIHDRLFAKIKRVFYKMRVIRPRILFLSRKGSILWKHLGMLSLSALLSLPPVSLLQSLART